MKAQQTEPAAEKAAEKAGAEYKRSGLRVRTCVKAGSGFWDDMRALYNLPPTDKAAS